VDRRRRGSTGPMKANRRASLCSKGSPVGWLSFAWRLQQLNGATDDQRLATKRHHGIDQSREDITTSWSRMEIMLMSEEHHVRP
jgi:hypothetical protein